MEWWLVGIVLIAMAGITYFSINKKKKWISELIKGGDNLYWLSNNF